MSSSVLSFVLRISSHCFECVLFRRVQRRLVSLDALCCVFRAALPFSNGLRTHISTCPSVDLVRMTDWELCTRLSSIWGMVVAYISCSGGSCSGLPALNSQSFLFVSLFFRGARLIRYKSNPLLPAGWAPRSPTFLLAELSSLRLLFECNMRGRQNLGHDSGRVGDYASRVQLRRDLPFACDFVVFVFSPVQTLRFCLVSNYGCPMQIFSQMLTNILKHTGPNRSRSILFLLRL